MDDGIPPDGPSFSSDFVMKDYLDDRPMELDSLDEVNHTGINLTAMERFCKDAARAFFNERGLISHQINSYNEFIDHGLQDLFDSIGEITVEPAYDPTKKGIGEWRYATVTFGKVRVEKPTFWSGRDDLPEENLKLMPRHSRLQHMTYSGQMKIEVRVQVYVQEKSDKVKTGTAAYIQKRILKDETREIVIGRLPIMVKSKLCWLQDLDRTDCLFDYGGYFLIKGAEKTFIAQEQRCLTRLWINDKPNWTISYHCETKRKRVFVKLVEASNTEGFHGAKVVNVIFLNAIVPAWILFFALGAENDKEVFEMIDLQDCDTNLVNIISSTINDADNQCSNFRGGEYAKEYVYGLVGKTKFPPKESFDECIRTYLFPAVIGTKQKRLFLAYMIKCMLLAYSGKRKCDNVNDFRNKRLELAGELLRRELWANLKHAEKRMVRAMQKALQGDHDLHFVERYLDASIITNGLNRAFSTGNWCHSYKRAERISGVVATLRRTNPLQMTSDLRKTRWQVSYAGKSGDARYPNPSYWGKLCFLSTPDGENCGLVKNLAVTAIVSSKVKEPLVEKLVAGGMENLEDQQLSSLRRMYKVFLNGDWVGVCNDSVSFVQCIREMRRKKQIHYQVEIKRDEHHREVRLFSDAGRILRPLLIVENLKKINNLKGGVRSFQYLVDEEIIEFVGVEEEEDCRTAWGVKNVLSERQSQSAHKYPARDYTHSELDLSFLMGLSCGLIPFANHNLAKRVLFEAEKHSQQAIGFSTTNPTIRTDTLSHQLYYPQRPLFKTMLADSLGKADLSMGTARPEYFNGQNAIVAVNVHLGYNQEDSLVMNRSSLERGMFRTEIFKSYKADVENQELTKLRKPKDKVDFGKMQSKKGRVDNLDDDGFPYIGASVQSGDIIIGKTSESGEDYGVKLKHTERGMVQQVILSANDEGKNFAAVTLRQVRSPCVGDKFTSMHGQKGVIGFLESQENFPFTSQGIVPDIVINPHAFPTRQTPGQLLEAALGKGIACGGSARYATPFTTPSVDVITEQLHRAGYQRWGSERVLNGRTGEVVRSLIFMGPNFYQRLIHMAEDKVKFRNTGPVHPVTRQPVADRKRFGGVKFGEMERDCMLAHGAAANLHERLFVLSDFSQMHICRSCKRVATVIQRPTVGGKKIRGPYCMFCESGENIVRANVPYGAKLLYQELFCMGICLKFETEVC